ncbi:hypothetical protein BD410DRAFT_790482 [Rickenella mellea]|uniref:F-box domain-containing protein n=1 Tax=Rickenella mellea TaxID=50990 RepID=A0A4Y7Q0I7_9AGAM|nr:hypothetical protein BD410DRAFT_790482 [Rickenella mellea]
MFLESMEQELSSLKQVLSPLLEKHDKLNDRILALKALLTPARRLLPELLSEVFTHANHAESELHSGALLLSRPRVYDTPLKLGRICRRWRQIAMSTPSLWSGVGIPAYWRAEGLREWTSRAGSGKFSFSIFVGQQDVEVLNLLASSQKRWKDVILHFDPSLAGHQLFREFLQSLSCSFDNLQTLNIYRTPPSGGPPSPANVELILGVDSAPNLRSLYLNAPQIKILTVEMLPFPCLREIKVESDPIPAADFFSLLQLSPAVEVVHAYVAYIPDSDDTRHEVLTLSNLKHLEVSEQYVLEGHRLCPLEKLDLPALERLSFRFADRWNPSPIFSPNGQGPHIRSLIYNSRPPLTSLRIRGCRMPAADIASCIPFLPNLSCIDIEHLGASDVWDGVVQLLTGPIPPSDENLSGCY